MLLYDLNYIVNVVIWPKFGNSAISMEVITISIYMDLTRKTDSSEEWSCSKSNNLGLVLGMALKICTSVEKGLKLKVRKFQGIIPMFGEVTGEKLARGLFFPIPE